MKYKTEAKLDSSKLKKDIENTVYDLMFEETEREFDESEVVREDLHTTNINSFIEVHRDIRRRQTFGPDPIKSVIESVQRRLSGE